MTDTDCPPTVSEPVRETGPELAAAVTVNVPGPDPDVPPVAVSHDALELAVHAHPLPVATETVPAPPAAPIVIDVGVRVYVQVGCAGFESQPASATMEARDVREARANTRKCMGTPSANGTVCAPWQVALSSAGACAEGLVGFGLRAARFATL